MPCPIKPPRVFFLFPPFPPPIQMSSSFSLRISNPKKSDWKNRCVSLFFFIENFRFLGMDRLGKLWGSLAHPVLYTPALQVRASTGAKIIASGKLGLLFLVFVFHFLSCCSVESLIDRLFFPSPRFIGIFLVRTLLKLAMICFCSFSLKEMVPSSSFLE